MLDSRVDKTLMGIRKKLKKEGIVLEILIMGGTEFVSEALAKYMIKKGHSVSIFTRGVKPVRYSGYTQHYKGDRKSKEDLQSTIGSKCFDYVLDCSAYVLEDVTALFKVLELTKLKRYILCSSGTVYVPSEEIIDEEFPRGENKNWGEYGLGKLAIEEYLFKRYREDKLPVTIFRPTYIYGAGNNLYREAYLFDRLSKELPILVPHSETKVQFIYIEDLLKLFEAAMHNEKAIGQAYNTTHEETVTWEKWVNTAAKVVGKKPQIKKIKTPENTTSRIYFPFRDCTYLLNTNKCTKDLVAAQINLEEGLKLAYNSYKQEESRVLDERMLKGIEALLDSALILNK